MWKFLFVICLLAGSAATAQTCTGGLGDPIANITFGQGAGVGGPLAAGITNLVYQAADCPSDGYYTIVNHTSNCFGGSWFSVGQDHTGNQDGYFMLVNASFQPSDFYVQTVNGLCGNTSYQFAAWVLNMVSQPNEILPNITFRIEKTDGTVLQSFATGDIPETSSPTWNQYAFYFSTPPGINSVVLRMTNNAPGGTGNDIALDDITFRPAGSSITSAVAGYPADTVNLCINAQPTLNINATVESCYPSESVQWQQSLDGGQSWADIPGAVANNITRSPTAAGLYMYRLTAAQTGNLGISTCQVASPPVAGNVIPIPSPTISISLASDTICAGSPVTIFAKPVDEGNDAVYQWLVNGSVVNTITGGTSPGFVSSRLNNGDIVKCVMTSDAACVIDPVATSNSLPVPIIPIPVTAVTVTASATQVCADSMVVFTATPSNGGLHPNYQWQVNGASIGGDSAVYHSSGLQNGDVVNCTMTGGLVCSRPVKATSAVAMTIYPLPVIALDTGVIIAGGSSTQLQPAVSGSLANWNWTPLAGLEDPTALQPVANPVITTYYTLTVVTTNGCSAKAAEMVNVFYDLRLPAAFSPNGDGHNDVFRVPPQTAVTIKRFAVYNREGAMVFYTTNVGAGWDGTYNGQPQPAGSYVWFVEYNNPLTRQVGEKQGTVVLVR